MANRIHRMSKLNTLHTLVFTIPVVTSTAMSRSPNHSCPPLLCGVVDIPPLTLPCRGPLCPRHPARGHVGVVDGVSILE